MTENNLLLGSISNDLYRVAALTQRGSLRGAQTFFAQAQHWAGQVKSDAVAPYIQKILKTVMSQTEITLDTAEDMLMYSNLIQNYTLKKSQ